MSKHQDITPKDAGKLLNEILGHLDHFTRPGSTGVLLNRVQIMTILFDTVNAYGLQVPTGENDRPVRVKGSRKK